MKLRGRKQEVDIFSEDMGDAAAVPTISCEQFRALEDFLKEKDNPALLPIQSLIIPGSVSVRSVPSPGRISTWTSSI